MLDPDELPLAWASIFSFDRVSDGVNAVPSRGDGQKPARCEIAPRRISRSRRSLLALLRPLALLVRLVHAVVAAKGPTARPRCTAMAPQARIGSRLGRSAAGAPPAPFSLRHVWCLLRARGLRGRSRRCGRVRLRVITANVVELPPFPMSVRMGYDQLDETHELAGSLRVPAELASSLAVRVERVRVRSPRPVAALLELVAERSAGLLSMSVPDAAKSSL